MQRLPVLLCLMTGAAASAYAQAGQENPAPPVIQAPADAMNRITPAQRDDSILSTRHAPGDAVAAPLPWQKAEPAAPAVAPSPFAPPKPNAALPTKVPFGRAEPSGPVIPSAPHISAAVPVVNVDAIEASEAAPPTPVAPEADPVQQDPAEPTELTSPIFEPEGAAIAPRRVVLRVLNKVTAQSQVITIKPNETVKIGQLQITAVTCQKSAENSQTDYAGLLDIAELSTTPGQAPRALLRGWMYASSPSVSALEHPIYDVTMVSCEMLGVAAKKEADKPVPAARKQKPAGKR